MAVDPRLLDRELAGLDALELDVPEPPSRAWRLWSALWPKLAAVALAAMAWQAVVWSGWRPEYVLPGPDRVLGTADDPGIPNQTEFFAGRVLRQELVTGLNVAKPVELGLPGPVNVAFGAAFRRERYVIRAGELASYINGFHLDQDSSDVAPAGSSVFPGFTPTDATDRDRDRAMGRHGAERAGYGALGRRHRGRDAAWRRVHWSPRCPAGVSPKPSSSRTRRRSTPPSPRPPRSPLTM
jgi:hypothetical protein